MADDPNRRDQPGPAERGGPSPRGSARGTATMSRGRHARPAPARAEHGERNRSLLPITLGLVGVVALGGLIAGLVASHSPSTPTAAPATRVLSTLTSRGDASAPSFVTPSSPLTARYTYACPVGTTGHFVAQFETAAGSAIRTIVDSAARSGSGATTVHAPPPAVGTPYHVAVIAPSGNCSYHIVTTTTS